jgi:hypothetical protein
VGASYADERDAEDLGELWSANTPNPLQPTTPNTHELRHMNQPRTVNIDSGGGGDF